jgi:hypothetical protein
MRQNGLFCTRQLKSAEYSEERRTADIALVSQNIDDPELTASFGIEIGWPYRRAICPRAGQDGAVESGASQVGSAKIGQCVQARKYHRYGHRRSGCLAGPQPG